MKFFISLFLCVTSLLFAKDVLYIHGDIAPDGTIPSGSVTPFEQMLLSDTGNRGTSKFKTLVEDQGYTIESAYDARFIPNSAMLNLDFEPDLTMNLEFLNQYDVIIFGLHQRIWIEAEKSALDTWLRAGGGMLIYSDSASGGLFSQPGIGLRNTTGQMATNNLISSYGMQVTVDQGGGTRSYIPDSGLANPIVWDQPELEGEGVSPVAVDPAGGAEILIPLLPANRVGGGSNLNIDERNITITNPNYAALALQKVGLGHIIVIYDRQPFWNNGPGSDIERKDNEEILRRIVRFLARDYGNSPEWIQFRINADTIPLEVSWRQWSGGMGTIGSSYNARNSRIQLEYSTTLLNNSWSVDENLITPVGTPVNNGDETETVTVRLADPTTDTNRLFARLARVPNAGTSEVILVEAGQDRFIGETGRVALEGQASGGTGPLTITWSKISGPGTVSFANGTAAETTATFGAAGTYELSLSATDGSSTVEDRLNVRVVANADIVRAVNCGNVTNGFTGANGFTYEADTLFSNGRTDTFPGNAVSSTEDDALYNYARTEFNNYTIPVSNDTYTVYLQFAETFFTSANERVFDVSLEGSLVLNDLDIAATAPGKWVAYDQAFTTTVTDGNLVISTTASVNNSLLNAFVVIQE